MPFDAVQDNTIGRMTAPLYPKYGQKGEVFRAARAHTTLTTGTPYRIKYDEYGPVTAALADDTDTYRVGVATGATKAGEIAWLQTGGYYAGMVTPSLSVSVGHGLGVTDGVVADSGADFDDLHGSIFAVNTVATTTATSHNVILVDEPITATT